MATTHKDLEVYKLSISFVTQVYASTATFPKEEIFGLVSQLRRAAVSIPSNIAEGAARKGNNEYIHFLYIALGSMAEVETQILIAYNLQYLNEGNYQHLSGKVEEIGRMLSGLIRYRKGLQKI